MRMHEDEWKTLDFCDAENVALQCMIWVIDIRCLIGTEMSGGVEDVLEMFIFGTSPAPV